MCFLILAIQIGFVPDSYSFDEAAGFASLMITTNNPALFIDATGALFLQLMEQ